MKQAQFHKCSILNEAIILFSLILMVPACQSPNSEQSQDKQKVERATIEDVEKGIRTHIEKEVAENDGYFHYEGDTSVLDLKLVRVHTEYLSVLGSNKFFACVDLATIEGDVYDVDFFLDGTADSMKVTRTNLHKLNGKPYYTWKQAKDKTWFTVPVKNASNDLLGVIEGQDRFTFKYEVQLPKISAKGELWLPLAQSDRFQQIVSQTIEAPVDYSIIKEATFGNQILFMEISPEHSEEKITITYDVIREEKTAYRDEEADLDQYLKGTPLIPLTDRFSTIANEVLAESNASTPLTEARALYDYIIDNMRYAKQGTYGTGDANYACDSKSGNCTEFHSFFIALVRSVGIPARFAVGASIPSERNEGGVNGYHCWAEFYAEGKWWPIDISEGNKYTPLATYYFGHHPANRIELSKGRNLEISPGPVSGPIPFMAYPILEINEQPVNVKTTFSFQRKPNTSS
ncbi:transglutaminase-like domain-containing protein [Ekhidna sp.]|uniref:transglutaminase-like domain-containing protein n=1 Tax=Ekhidna sp. TaxID=2608089 RepID=UPI003CCBFAD2